jgi:hypothetical protein
MQIKVLVERVKRNGYRARGSEPFAISARGATPDEAVAKLRAKIQSRLGRGAKLVSLEIGAPVHPWMRFAGMFKDDPRMDEWVKSMADYRKQVEDDPNR